MYAWKSALIWFSVYFVCLFLRFLRRYKTLIYISGYQYIKPSFKHLYNIHAVWLIFFPPLSCYGKSSGLSKFFLILSHSKSQYQRNSNAMNGNKTCLLSWPLGCICGRISVCTEITPQELLAVLLKVL